MIGHNHFHHNSIHGFVVLHVSNAIETHASSCLPCPRKRAKVPGGVCWLWWGGNVIHNKVVNVFGIDIVFFQAFVAWKHDFDRCDFWPDFKMLRRQHETVERPNRRRFFGGVQIVT